MARQYARPQGWFGRLVLGRLLNRINATENDWVFEQLDLHSDARLLEVGFGGGALLEKAASTLTNGSADGVEMSAEMMDRFTRRLRRLDLEKKIRLHRSVLPELPFEAALFDRICSINTVYFWPDLRAGANELFRLTRSGGRLVLGFGDADAMRAEGFEERGFRLYEPEVIAAALSDAGYQSVEVPVLERPGQGNFNACVGVRTE